MLANINVINVSAHQIVAFCLNKWNVFFHPIECHRAAYAI